MALASGLLPMPQPVTMPDGNAGEPAVLTVDTSTPSTYTLKSVALANTACTVCCALSSTVIEELPALTVAPFTTAALMVPPHVGFVSTPRNTCEPSALNVNAIVFALVRSGPVLNRAAIVNGYALMMFCGARPRWFEECSTCIAVSESWATRPGAPSVGG